MQTGHLGARSAKDRWVLPGAAMGVAAGMIFVTFQMVAAVFVGEKLLSPLSMVGAVVLGQVPLEQSFPLEFTALVGLLIYVIVSAACGAAFGALSAVGPVRRSRGALLVAATAFGSLLWMTNFALVAQGAPLRFPAASPVVQFVAHTFFFGAVLALMLGVRTRSEEPAREEMVAGGRPRDLDPPRGYKDSSWLVREVRCKRTLAKTLVELATRVVAKIAAYTSTFRSTR